MGGFIWTGTVSVDTVGEIHLDWDSLRMVSVDTEKLGVETNE